MKKYNTYTNKLDWLKEYKLFQKYFNNDLFVKNVEVIKYFLNTLDKSPTSSQLKKLCLLCDLCSLYEKDILKKYNDYKKK